MSDCIDKLQSQIDEIKKEHKKLMSGTNRGKSSSSSAASMGSEKKAERKSSGRSRSSSK